MADLTPIWISLKTALTATVITFFLGIIAAHSMLGYRGKLKGLIESCLTIPLVLPPTVVGFVLLLLLGKNGFIGQILDYFGLTIVFSWYATVVASTVVAFPLMYKTALGAFKQIDPNLLACAKTLGASEWKIFWRIILPLAKPGIIAATLLSFGRALGEFGATLMLAGAIPGKTETIPIAIFFAVEGGERERALWLVVVILLISLSVIMAVNYWVEENKISRKNQTNFYSVDKFFFHRREQNTSPPQPASTKQPVRLIVDIQKQLPEFFLDITFAADHTPLGLLGASGAGKSLILKCIAGLVTPDKGRIVLNGKVLFDSQQGINLSSRDRACGFLFQDYALFPHLTVAENIAFGMPTHKSQSKIQAEIEKLLIALELSGKERRYPQELSGGEKQRVALARARASQPEIMLLDEPFSALDTYLRDKQTKLLRNNLNYYPGITLFITHNLEEAYCLCPKLLVIDRGKAITYGTKQAIFQHPGKYRTAQLTGCKNFSRAIAISAHCIKAVDWDCLLEIRESSPKFFKYVGIRPYQLIFSSRPTKNTFPAWLTATIETPHCMTLYIKLHQPANHTEDYHLQAEVSQDKWWQLKDQPLPWQVELSPRRLMLLS